MTTQTPTDGPQWLGTTTVMSPPALSSATGPTLPPFANAAPSAPPVDPRLELPTPTPTPSPRRGWRVAAAFVAGAVVGGASFGLGQITADPDPVVQTPAISDAALSPSADPAGPTGAGDQAGPGSIIVTPDETVDPVVAVAQVLGPSVVQVETDLGLGSGVVFDDGLLLTNHHVIEGASQVRIRTSDGRALDAEVIGSDPRNDIAVVSVGEGAGLPIATLGDGELEVGQLAVAIGSPFQLQQTVTSGIVSALNRPVPNAVGGFNAMVQTDTAINPGNSGGALADREGRVIGINTSIRTDGTGNSNVGIGFAVPIDTALNVANRILDGENLEPGVLGVSSASQVDGEVGVLIGEVNDGSGAAAAGLEVGDRVLTVDGAPVSSFAELAGLVQSGFPGDEVDLVVERGASRQRLELVATLG